MSVLTIRRAVAWLAAAAALAIALAAPEAAPAATGGTSEAFTVANGGRIGIVIEEAVEGGRTP